MEIVGWVSEWKDGNCGMNGEVSEWKDGDCGMNGEVSGRTEIVE